LLSFVVVIFGVDSLRSSFEFLRTFEIASSTIALFSSYLMGYSMNSIITFFARSSTENESDALAFMAFEHFASSTLVNATYEGYDRMVFSRSMFCSAVLLDGALLLDRFARPVTLYSTWDRWVTFIFPIVLLTMTVGLLIGWWQIRTSYKLHMGQRDKLLRMIVNS